MAVFYVLPLCFDHHLPSLPAWVALYKQMLKFPLRIPRLVSLVFYLGKLEFS